LAEKLKKPNVKLQKTIDKNTKENMIKFASYILDNIDQNNLTEGEKSKYGK
jgi:hypothetical protein